MDETSAEAKSETSSENTPIELRPGLSHKCLTEKGFAKRPRSDVQNGPCQPECCTVAAQKIWWRYCRPDCLAQNASLHVQQHNSKPCSLMAVVTALCVARRQPTNHPTRLLNFSFNSPYKRTNFRDDFLVYDHTTGKTPVLVLCRSGTVKSVDFLVKNLPSNV